jgi:hypothetical protein
MARPLKFDYRLNFRITYELWKQVKKDAEKKKIKPTVLLRKVIEDKFNKA